MRLLDAIFKFIWEVQKFREVKNSDKREKSMKYGVTSIIYSIIASLSFFPITFGLNLLTEDLGGVVVGLLLLLIGISFVLAFIIAAIKTMIYQLILNRRAIGWIALGFNILILVAAYFIFNSFSSQ